MTVDVLFHVMVLEVNDLNISIFNLKAGHWSLESMTCESYDLLTTLLYKYDHYNCKSPPTLWQHYYHIYDQWPPYDLTHQVVHGGPALGRDVAPGEVFPLPPLRLLHRQRQHRHRGPSRGGHWQFIARGAKLIVTATHSWKIYQQTYKSKGHSSRQ